MAAFSRVWSGTTEFWPPAWQAAQLALKIFSPASTSPAKAGPAARMAAPAAATLATPVTSLACNVVTKSSKGCRGRILNGMLRKGESHRGTEGERAGGRKGGGRRDSSSEGGSPEHDGSARPRSSSRL
eukprot:756996-Hanusia_phi.AAC.2